MDNATFTTNYSQSLTPVNQEILMFLQLHCVGRNHAITAKKLGSSTGRSTREIRQAILELRRSGEPIASSVNAPYGFFIPENETEAHECLNHLYSRIQEIYKTACSVERGLKKRFPSRQMQLHLEDGDNPN